MISTGGAGARGTNGTLSPATARTRSGCSQAVFQARSAPQSWPITTASRAPACSIRRDHVGGLLRDRVGLDGLRRVGEPEAAQVGHEHPVARVRERRDLVAPRVAELGKAVQQHDERPAGRTVLGDVQAYPHGRHPRACARK